MKSRYAFSAIFPDGSIKTYPADSANHAKKIRDAVIPKKPLQITPIRKSSVIDRLPLGLRAVIKRRR